MNLPRLHGCRTDLVLRDIKVKSGDVRTPPLSFRVDLTVLLQ